MENGVDYGDGTESYEVRFMKYMGGKFKLAKHFLPIVLKGRKEYQFFVEPFCGGCNVTVRVEGPRIANDVNRYIIAMYQAVQKGWKAPNVVTFSDYEKIKNNPDLYPPELVGFVGTACSFAGKFLDVYARSGKGGSDQRDIRKFNNRSKGGYAAAGARTLERDRPFLEGVQFYSMDYRSVPIPPGAVVYCDPPYVGTAEYEEPFDHVAFWAWVRNLSMYHRVCVSEYTAPKDFKAVWKAHRIDGMNAVNGGLKHVVECLWVWKHSPHV